MERVSLAQRGPLEETLSKGGGPFKKTPGGNFFWGTSQKGVCPGRISNPPHKGEEKYYIFYYSTGGGGRNIIFSPPQKKGRGGENYKHPPPQKKVGLCPRCERKLPSTLLCCLLRGADHQSSRREATDGLPSPLQRGEKAP